MLLLDSEGKILAVGREVLRRPFSEAGPPMAQIQSAVSGRFSEVEIEKASIAPLRDRGSGEIVDRAGNRVTLYTGWLSARSALPSSGAR